MKTKKHIIEEYAQKISLSLKKDTYLAEDLASGNWRALRFPAYSIQKLPHIRNLTECFVDLANIKIENNESQSKYYNQLTEFHAVWFASHILKLNMIAMEHKRSPILSPNRKRNCSCDILAKRSKTNIYFEVKSLSSETLTQYIDDSISPDHVFFKPSLPSKRQQNWLNKMLNKSFEKGANYLICRIPVWSSYGMQGFGAWWVRNISGKVQKVSTREYIVSPTCSVPRFFKGIYLIHNRRHLFVKLARINRSSWRP